jgi:CO/xanthine dehydrogenase Mo-binding subunit
MAVTRLFGSAVRRREDPRLIAGRATYVGDITLPGMAYAAILRSPFAHARIRRIDTSKARALPGVVAVYTGRDLQGNPSCRCPTAPRGMKMGARRLAEQLAPSWCCEPAGGI